MVLMNAPKEEDDEEEEKDVTRMDTDITDEEMAMRYVQKRNTTFDFEHLCLQCTLSFKAIFILLLDMEAWLKA